MLLTTTGRQTGRPRETPLCYLTQPECWVVVASNGGNEANPAWWANLQSDPTASVRIGSSASKVDGRLATPDKRAKFWPMLVNLYPGYEGYDAETDREIPVVVLENSG